MNSLEPLQTQPKKKGRVLIIWTHTCPDRQSGQWEPAVSTERAACFGSRQIRDKRVCQVEGDLKDKCMSTAVKLSKNTPLCIWLYLL